MIRMKCPVCEGSIEITDTSLSTSQEALMIYSAVKIETTLRHVGIPEPDCGRFMQELAREQADTLKQVMEKRSQDLHTL